jgi:hypothetical protein
MHNIHRFIPGTLAFLMVALIFYSLGTLFSLPVFSAVNTMPLTSPSESPLPGSSSAINDVPGLTEAMESNFKGVTDYSLKGYIRLESGTVIVNYRCVRPQTVRTEITGGKGKGTVVLYVPDQRKDQVKAKSGSFRVWRNIRKLKIENTPLVESLLDTLLKLMKEMKDATFMGDVHMEAHLGDKIEIALTPDPFTSMTPSPSTPSASPSLSPQVMVSPALTPTSSLAPVPTPTPTPSGAAKDPYADVLGMKNEPAESPTSERSPDVKGTPQPNDKGEGQPEKKHLSMDCFLVMVKGEEFNDTIAVDKGSLWPVYARRAGKDGKLVFEAIITGIITNTSPKMEL